MIRIPSSDDKFFDIQPLKREVELPLLTPTKMVLCNSTHYARTAYVAKVMNFVNASFQNDKIIEGAFDEFCFGKKLQGNELLRLLSLFYSTYPYYNKFIRYICLNRGTWMNKDEWCMLYYERKAILSNGETRCQRISCLLSEYSLC